MHGNKRLRTMYALATFVIVALCIYLPRSMMIIRWVAVGFSITLLPIFIYLNRSRPRVFVIATSCVYVANSIVLATIGLDINIFGLATQTLSNIVAVAYFVVALPQVITEYRNQQQSQTQQ